MREIAVFLFVAIAAFVASPQDTPRFSAAVHLVQLDVQVTEKGTGRIVELLGPNDFEIYDEGLLREIRDFHFETMPVDFVFVTYGKGGLGTPKDINEFRRGLFAAAAELRPNDRGAVLRTADKTQVDLQLTGDRESVRWALVGRNSRYEPGYDRLYDAVSAATTLFPRPRDRTRRRAIIAITDDIERESKTTLPELIVNLLESDATLHAAICVLGKQPSREVGVGGVWGIPRVSRKIGGERTGASLREAVQATGGESIPCDVFREALPELVRRIRQRYVLGFYADPNAALGFHRVEVKLTPEAKVKYPQVVVRARRGYYSDSK
jgi:VWFA-related protein